MGPINGSYDYALSAHTEWTAEEIATWNEPEPEATSKGGLTLVVNNGITPSLD